LAPIVLGKFTSFTINSAAQPSLFCQLCSLFCAQNCLKSAAETSLFSQGLLLVDFSGCCDSFNALLCYQQVSLWRR
jgi:hypothetical protein